METVLVVLVSSSDTLVYLLQLCVFYKAPLLDPRQYTLLEACRTWIRFMTKNNDIKETIN